MIKNSFSEFRQSLKHASREDLLRQLYLATQSENKLEDKYEVVSTARPLDEWHEDHGPVIWWVFPIECPPYVGTPLDEDWIGDCYTHWTPIVVPEVIRDEDHE